MATPDDRIIDAVAEKVDKRNLWRRNEDVRRNAVIVALAGLLITGGVAWGTSFTTVSNRLSEKVDRTEFTAHVTASDRRLLVDSLEREHQAEALKRIESKVDSGNARMSRFICANKPAYCQ